MALVFAVMGGVGALVAGLVVTTFVLLHDSATTVLRHVPAGWRAAFAAPAPGRV